MILQLAYNGKSVDKHFPFRYHAVIDQYVFCNSDFI